MAAPGVLTVHARVVPLNTALYQSPIITSHLGGGVKCLTVILLIMTINFLQKSFKQKRNLRLLIGRCVCFQNFRRTRSQGVA